MVDGYAATVERRRWERERHKRDTGDCHLTASAGASREHCGGMQVATRGGGQNDRDEATGAGTGRGVKGGAGSGPMCLSRFYKSIKRGISD